MGDELQTPLSHWSCLLVPFCHQDKCQVALWDYSSRHLGQGLFPELQIRAPTWASYRRAIHSSLVTHYPLPRSLPSLGALVGGPGGGEVLGFPNSVLKVLKQVARTLSSQVLKHLAGHLLSKKAFLIRTQRQVWGAREGRTLPPPSEVTPDFSEAFGTWGWWWECCGGSLGGSQAGGTLLGATPG